MNLNVYVTVYILISTEPAPQARISRCRTTFGGNVWSQAVHLRLETYVRLKPSSCFRAVFETISFIVADKHALQMISCRSFIAVRSLHMSLIRLTCSVVLFVLWFWSCRCYCCSLLTFQCSRCNLWASNLLDWSVESNLINIYTQVCHVKKS